MATRLTAAAHNNSPPHPSTLLLDPCSDNTDSGQHKATQLGFGTESLLTDIIIKPP